MKKVSFIIPGAPVPKERPRMTKSGHTYTPARTRAYEATILANYKQQVGREMIPAGTPICMWVYAYYPIPKSTTKMKKEAMKAGTIRPTKRPDADNILKAIADAVNGTAYHDDSQIVTATIEKWYSDYPRVEVTIMETSACDKPNEQCEPLLLHGNCDAWKREIPFSSPLQPGNVLWDIDDIITGNL